MIYRMLLELKNQDFKQKLSKTRQTVIKMFGNVIKYVYVSIYIYLNIIPSILGVIISYEVIEACLSFISS